MKILFVSSGNKKETISTLVYDQGESIKRTDFDLNYYTIVGKGLPGYFKNIFKLRNYIKNNKVDVVHAHYSLSGFVAALSGAKYLVVSLMGSDVKQNWLWRIVIKFFISFFWDACIVKATDMQKSLKIKNTSVIPNGVNMKLFLPLSKEEAQKQLGWNLNSNHILFAADPDRQEKNFILANKAFNLLPYKNTEIHFLKNVLKSEVHYFYSASDIILLTSLWEGSPNVIKEAMACNRPIVATNVGDIKRLFGDTDGCYLASFKAENVKDKLIKAMEFSKKEGNTLGRNRIIELGLDSETIANEIINVYKTVLTS